MTIVYEDSCENMYPIVVNGARMRSKEEFELNLIACGIERGDTLKVSIKDDNAIISRGDKVTDRDDVLFESVDSCGNYVLKGCGG